MALLVLALITVSSAIIGMASWHAVQVGHRARLLNEAVHIAEDAAEAVALEGGTERFQVLVEAHGGEGRDFVAGDRSVQVAYGNALSVQVSWSPDQQTGASVYHIMVCESRTGSIVYELDTVRYEGVAR